MIYYLFWATLSTLVYIQMCAVAAVMYENHRVVAEGLVLTEEQRKVALVKRTLWFAFLPATAPIGLINARGKTHS